MMFFRFLKKLLKVNTIIKPSYNLDTFTLLDISRKSTFHINDLKFYITGTTWFLILTLLLRAFLI